MKIIAFYLPQFYRTEINDKWWGEGYTEWTASKKALPSYENHYQPHIPYNNYYYNLLEKDTMIWQANLMHEYGIDALCFYHYWFSSEERTLEKPAENLLSWDDIDMPFCFSWANESWLNKWNAGEGFAWVDKTPDTKKGLRYIFVQKYGREDEWEKHFRYLLPFFKDKRYIKVAGKPLFVINNIYNIPCIHEMVTFWNRLAYNYGFPGIYFIGCGNCDINCNVDAYMTHEPGNVRGLLTPLDSMHPTRYSYSEAAECILNQKYVVGKKIIYSTFCSYDTTPRYGIDADVYDDGTPEVFSEHLSRLIAKNYDAGIDMIFIDAWNEWGEGMHLEPDMKYGNRWLLAVKNAKIKYLNYIDYYKEKNEYMSKDLFKHKCLIRKAEICTNVMDRWMHLREKGICITDYLSKNGINRVILYGMGQLANHIVWDCKNSKTSIVGIIDRSYHYTMEGVDLYKIQDNLPEFDAIIVTAVYHMDSICDEIRNRGIHSPIFSLMELIIFGEENAERN